MMETPTLPDYRALIDNISGVVYTTDIRGLIEFASPGVYALTGYVPEELVGQHFSFLVSPECLKGVYDHYRGQLQAPTRETILEFYCLTREGEKKWVEQTALLLNRKDGTQGFQCFVRDISEKKDFQRQLIIAKNEAEEARRLQEQFLANMSHEIRTPMNGIVGMTNLLLETPLSTQQEQFANVIHRSADNLLVIIDDILDLSKIKAGKMTIEKIPFRLQDVTANVWALFEQRIIKKGLQFAVELDPRIPASMIGDPHRLNQVLINLVGNAVKFTEKGSIRISVQQIQQTSPKTVNLRFTIADTGMGIAKDQLPHIFESFSQAAADITRKYGGTGLGLTICKNLLTMQGGDISVESEPGKGTCFSFHIAYGCESSRIADHQKTKSPQDHQAAFKGKHFLVVEDNPINQQLIEYVIRKAGAQVTVANHGGEAIDHLQANRYDLIIMDLQMPVMDGYETTKHLREMLKLQTPVLAMTANALKGEQVRCLEAGMNGYMSKPFEFREFYSRVAELLETGKVSPAQSLQEPLHPEVLFNLSLLEDVGDKDFVRDTIGTFLDALPTYLTDLESAFADKNYDRLSFLAHKFKGTMGIFQAQTIAEQLDKIEQIARERSDPGGLIPITLHLFRQLERDLRKYDCPQTVNP
jgi:PAS domain S-box-containing protein